MTEKSKMAQIKIDMRNRDRADHDWKRELHESHEPDRLTRAFGKGGDRQIGAGGLVECQAGGGSTLKIF